MQQVPVSMNLRKFNRMINHQHAFFLIYKQTFKLYNLSYITFKIEVVLQIVRLQ